MIATPINAPMKAIIVPESAMNVVNAKNI